MVHWDRLRRYVNGVCCAFREPRLAAEGFLGVQRGVLGGSVAFVAPDDSLAWLDEDDAVTQTGDNLLKLMTVARLTKISDHRIGSPRC